MATNIIILSDGTGNAASSVWRTNVWRTFQALDLQGNYQAAKYDDGVGTSSFLPLAILGGVFGFGLKRNILAAYKFVCRNYKPGTKLYFLGFSRGAFTVRVLNAFILEQGLVQATSESELHDLARKAYRAYRANGYHSILRIEVPLRWVRDRFAYLRDKLTRRKSYDPADNVTVPTVEFIGVWDTVAAYGLPIDEMTRGVSNWIWPLELPNRVLSPRVLCARHALALDDERTTFHPVLWTEEDEPQVGSQIGDQRLVQAWFVGMHSNVGGGYPDDALAFVAYYWIINEARQRGLMFKSEPVAEPDTFKTVRSGRDKDARLYDSRSGVGGYYRYGPRKVDDLCKDADNGVKITLPLIHESVFGRIDSGCNAYAPIVLPPVYATLMDNGRVLSPTENQFETPAQAAARHKAQERIWNFVWLRRIVYFITIAATFHLAAFWIFHAQNAKHEFESAIRLVSEIVRFVESFLPRSLHWWTDWYAGNPEWFAGGVAAVTVFTLAGSKLSARISDLMRIVWNSKGATDPVPRNTFHDVIFAIRTSRVYQAIIWAGRRHVVPLLSVLALSWAVLTLGSHLLVNIADSAGAFCTNTNEGTTKVNLGTVQEAPKAFDTRSICGATGLTVRRGYKYELTFEINEPWKDDAVPTDPIGYYSSSVKPPSNLVLYLGVPSAG